MGRLNQRFSLEKKTRLLEDNFNDDGELFLEVQMNVMRSRSFLLFVWTRGNNAKKNAITESGQKKIVHCEIYTRVKLVKCST